MLVRNAVLFSILLVMTIASNAHCEDKFALSSIEGVYEGNADVYDGYRYNSRSYVVTVVNTKEDSQELSLKFRCDDCTKGKQWFLKSCKVTTMSPALKFECRGDWGSGEFELTDQVLKGKGVFSKGPYPFSMKTKKIN